MDMINVEIMDDTLKEKKIFFRKELNEEKIGEKIYSTDVTGEHSVYVLRKFVFIEEYTEVEQFNFFLDQILEQFQQLFDDITIKSIHRDVKSKSAELELN